MTDTALFEIANARVVREGRPILDIEHLAFRENEHVAIIGPNGAGKSTLVRLLTRDVRPLHRNDRPTVLLRGKERCDLFAARTVFGVVSDTLQETYDRPVSVRDVVLSGFFGSIGLYRQAEVTPAMSTQAERLLEDLGIAGLAGRAMNTLSTGEARRALIARALVHDPDALVLDEPCDGLDPGATLGFLKLMRGLAENHALVLVTHHIDDIVPEIDRVVMLRDGRILCEGPKRDVLTEAMLTELFGFEARLEEREGFYRLRAR
ncbi:MAG: ATP-binding cassette domain-containing protein [Coriobacteriia bacterium]|nr:ATP-binding cassette domain-containing protein [Coriobacteriia bacterium]